MDKKALADNIYIYIYIYTDIHINILYIYTCIYTSNNQLIAVQVHRFFSVGIFFTVPWRLGFAMLWVFLPLAAAARPGFAAAGKT